MAIKTEPGVAGLLTVQQAAAILDMTDEGIRFAIRCGRLPGVKKYRQYWVSEKAIENYPSTRQAVTGRRCRIAMAGNAQMPGENVSIGN